MEEESLKGGRPPRNRFPLKSGIPASRSAFTQLRSAGVPEQRLRGRRPAPYVHARGRHGGHRPALGQGGAIPAAGLCATCEGLFNDAKAKQESNGKPALNGNGHVAGPPESYRGHEPFQDHERQRDHAARKSQGTNAQAFRQIDEAQRLLKLPPSAAMISDLERVEAESGLGDIRFLAHLIRQLEERIAKLESREKTTGP